jgi:hypothetical protein
LQDGATLLRVSGGGAPDTEKTLRIEAASRREEPPPTEILGPSVQPTASNSPVTIPQQPRPTELSAHGYAAPATTAGKKNVLVIPITIAATVLALALGGLGAWLLLGGRENGGADNGVRVNVGGAKGTPTPGSSPAASPTNAASAQRPAASPSPVDVAALRNEVTALLNGWANSSMAHDINTHMSYYADTLDTYYTKSNVSAGEVRADRQRAYETYSSLDISLSNIQITPDATGERATVVLDKTWNFTGEERATSGSVQQRLTLAKIAGRWRITGEKDLRVYYVNK